MLMAMTTGEIATLVGVVSGVGGSLLTFLATKGVDAWLKLRADQRIDVVREEEAEEVDLKFIITRQDTVIGNMSAEMRELRKEHIECERKHAELKARLEMLENRVTKQGG